MSDPNVIQVYVDPDTGEEYTADNIPTKYKARLDEFVPESTYMQAATDALQSGGYSFLSAMGSLGQGVGDWMSGFDNYVGNDSEAYKSLLAPDPIDQNSFGSSIDQTIAGWGDSLSKKGKEYRDYYAELANQELGNVAIDTSTPQGYAANFIAKGIPGASKMLAYTLPAIITRNPGLIAPVMTAGTMAEGFGQDYGQGRDAGLTPEQSALLGLERAVPNYIQAKAMAPLDALGGLKGLVGNTAGNLGAGALDMLNRSLTDQAIVEGNTPTLERTGSDLSQNAEQGLSEMILGQGVTRLGARAAGLGNSRKVVNDLNRDLEARIQDEMFAPQDTAALDSQLTDVEVTTIPETDAPERSLPATEKAVNQLEDTSIVPKSLKDVPTEDVVTKVRLADEVPVMEDSPNAVIDETVGQENAMFDDLFDPVKLPKEGDAEVESALNTKIDEVDTHYNNVMKVSEPLRPLVERQILDSAKAAAVSEGIPESHPALKDSARMLQLDFIQRANLGESTLPEINRLANDTSNISQAVKTLQLDSNPVDLLNKLEIYRKELDQFDSKIGTDKPFKKSLNTNEFKKAIQDEVAHAIDPYSDPEFFKQLAQVEPNQIGKLVKERIQQKHNGIIPSYGDAPGSFFDTIRNEKGAVNLKGGFQIFDDIVDTYRKNKAQINTPKVLHDEMMQAIHQKVLDTVGEIQPGIMIPKHKNAIEDFANGKIASLKGVIPDKILAPIEMAVKVSREYYTQPEKLVALDREGGVLKQAYDSTHRKENEKAVRLFQHLKTLQPYSDLIDKTLVNRILLLRHKQAKEAFQSGKKINILDDNAYRKLGAGDDEIAAIKAWDNTMKESWKMTTYAMKNYVTKNMTDPEAVKGTIKAIDEWAKAKENTYYIPKTRKGDWAVYATHSQSEKIAPFYNRYKSEAEAKKVASDLMKSNYNVKEPYKWKPPSDSAYALMPDEVILDINNILKGQDEVKTGKTIEGFKSHFLKADLNVDGDPTDLFRQAVDYLHGSSSLAAEWKWDSQIKGLLKEGVTKAPEAGDQLAKWYEYTKMNTSEARAWRTMIAQHNLGFLQPSSAVLNGLSSWTSTIPELARYTKVPVVGAYHQMGKAVKQYISYKNNPEKFRAENKKLYSLLEYAKRTGDLGVNTMKEYGTDSLSHSGMKKLSDVSMFLQGITEGMNRGGAIIAAYNNAPKGANKVKFALEFNNRVNNDYSRLNKPKRARGDGGLVGEFKAATYALKGFGHNYMSNLLEAVRGTVGGTAEAVGGLAKRDMSKASAGTKKALKNLEVLGHYSLPIAAVGGIRALPVAPQALALANFLGYDLERDIRNSIEDPKMSSMIVDGLPMGLFGISFSGALAPTAGIEVDRDALSTLGKGFIGPSYNLLEKFPRAMKGYQTQGLDRAVQELAPRSILRGMESYTASVDPRGFTDINGRSLSRFPGDLPTTKDLIVNAFGAQPAYKVDRKMEGNSQRLMFDKDAKMREGLGLRFSNKIADIVSEKGLQGQSWEVIKREALTDKRYLQSIVDEVNSIPKERLTPNLLKSILNKATGKEAESNYQDLSSQSIRALRKSPKDLRPDIAKIIAEDMKREKALQGK